MHSINSLLVVIEPHLMESLALKRAKHIASHTKAHLHLLICDKKNDHSALLSVLESSLKSEAYNVMFRCQRLLRQQGVACQRLSESIKLRPAVCLQGLHRTGRTQTPGTHRCLAARQP